MTRFKIMAAAVVLAVVFGFVRCGASAPTVTARCGDSICDETEDVASCAVDCDHDLVVVVEDALLPTLEASLATYVADLRAEERLARVVTWKPSSVEALKAFLFGQVDRYGVEGALLIGNFPAAFYEHRVICVAWDRLNRCTFYEYEEFPTDVYLQDRNASWEDRDGDGILDAHGELELEIFVSRLQILSQLPKCEKSELFPLCPEVYEPSEDFYATEDCLWRCPSRLRDQVWQEYESGSVECCGPLFLRRYFERLHRYRAEGSLTQERAVVFADDDFVHMVGPTGLEGSYEHVEVIVDPADTIRERYLKVLTGQGAELLHQLNHSTVRNLYFYTCVEWSDDSETCLDWSSERIYRTEISSGPFLPAHNLRVSFANMYNCHASRFTEPSLAMAFTLQTDFGLATVGNTRKGGMWDATVFHEALAEGESWGEAYRRWYNQVGKHDDRWYLGVVLTGDPMLTIAPRDGAADRTTLPTAKAPLHRTPRELLLGDPPGTFEDYKRANPRFFEN